MVEWCIEYEDDPRLLLRTSVAWYSLHEPSEAYAPVYRSGDYAAVHVCATAIDLLSADCSPPYNTLVELIRSRMCASEAAALLGPELCTTDGIRKLVAVNAGLILTQVRALTACGVRFALPSTSRARQSAARPGSQLLGEVGKMLVLRVLRAPGLRLLLFCPAASAQYAGSGLRVICAPSA